MSSYGNYCYIELRLQKNGKGMKKFLFSALLLLLVHCQRVENQAIPECGKAYPNMKCIPAGNFIRGSNVYEKDEKPEQTIYVSEFYMDTYEVTNEDFNKCIDAGKCKECLKNKTCNYIGPRYGKPYIHNILSQYTS